MQNVNSQMMVYRTRMDGSYAYQSLPIFIVGQNEILIMCQ